MRNRRAEVTAVIVIDVERAADQRGSPRADDDAVFPLPAGGLGLVVAHATLHRQQDP